MEETVAGIRETATIVTRVKGTCPPHLRTEISQVWNIIQG